MRIGISCYPTYGGSGIVATELAMALAMRPHLLVGVRLAIVQIERQRHRAFVRR